MHPTLDTEIQRANTNKIKEVRSNTIKDGECNTSLSTMARSCRQRVNKETADLNNTIDQIDLTDIENIPSNSGRTHVPLKCTWNIFQDRSYVRSQNNSQQIK